VHLFAFGIGTDVNTHLLDRLGNETRAFSQYVLPDEDLEVKLSSFYAKIQSPALVDVKLSLADQDGEVKLKQIYPDEMPDLFIGQTLLAFGRYTGSGNAKVQLIGKRDGDREAYSVNGNFPDKDDTHEFIARLWATAASAGCWTRSDCMVSRRN
jgi:Ca-activated chloride channel family protein